jgi:DNA-binding LytR/AlgR family response regulator
MRLNAIDYIDKPVDPAELKRAIEKSCISASTQNIINQKLRLFTEKGEMLFEPNEIMYFESHKRDAIAHFVNGFQNVKVRGNLKSLETILPSRIFVRSSRQYIINKQFIKFTSQSNHTITLLDGCKSIVLNKINPEFFKNLKI